MRQQTNTQEETAQELLNSSGDDLINKEELASLNISICLNKLKGDRKQ